MGKHENGSDTDEDYDVGDGGDDGHDWDAALSNFSTNEHTKATTKSTKR